MNVFHVLTWTTAASIASLGSNLTDMLMTLGRDGFAATCSVTHSTAAILSRAQLGEIVHDNLRDCRHLRVRQIWDKDRHCQIQGRINNGWITHLQIHGSS